MVRCHLCSKGGSPSSSGRIHPQPPTCGHRDESPVLQLKAQSPRGWGPEHVHTQHSSQEPVVPGRLVFFPARAEVEQSCSPAPALLSNLSRSAGSSTLTHLHTPDPHVPTTCFLTPGPHVALAPFLSAPGLDGSPSALVLVTFTLLESTGQHFMECSSILGIPGVSCVWIGVEHFGEMTSVSGRWSQCDLLIFGFFFWLRPVLLLACGIFIAACRI